MLPTIVLFVLAAWLLSSPWVKRALPFESFLAFGFAGVIMVALLMAGQLA